MTVSIFPIVSLDQHKYSVFGKENIQILEKFIEEEEKKKPLSKNYFYEKNQIIKGILERHLETLNKLFSQTFVSKVKKNTIYITEFENSLPLSAKKYETSIHHLVTVINDLKNQSILLKKPDFSLLDYCQRIYLNQEIEILSTLLENLQTKFYQVNNIQEFCKNSQQLQNAIELLPSGYYFSEPNKSIFENLKMAIAQFLKEISESKSNSYQTNNVTLKCILINALSVLKSRESLQKTEIRNWTNNYLQNTFPHLFEPPPIKNEVLEIEQNDTLQEMI